MELRGGLEMKQPKEKYAHYGLYMVLMSMLVLAIVVLANGIAHRLPVSWTQFDTLRRLRRLRRG